MLSAVGMYGRAVQDGRAAVERALLAPSLRPLFQRARLALARDAVPLLRTPLTTRDRQPIFFLESLRMWSAGTRWASMYYSTEASAMALMVARPSVPPSSG